MTHALRRLAILCVAAIGAASCSIHHRSGELACQSQADCSAGRSCLDGVCVVTLIDGGISGSGDAPGGTAPPDAPAIPLDAVPTCPAQCTACDPGALTCTIDCQADPAACTQKITCPPGWNCDVECTTAQSCRNGVACEDATACKINCAGQQSCANIACSGGACSVQCTGRASCSGVTCGEGTCDVACTANDSCATVSCGTGACSIGCAGNRSCSNVTCEDACACDVACQGTAGCGAVTCTAAACKARPRGCSASADPACNTCP